MWPISQKCYIFKIGCIYWNIKLGFGSSQNEQRNFSSKGSTGWEGTNRNCKVGIIFELNLPFQRDSNVNDWLTCLFFLLNTLFINYFVKCLFCFWCRGICSSDEDLYSKLEDIIPNLAKGYLHVFRKAISTSELFGPSSIDQLKAREFFGLRDFYRYRKLFSKHCYFL